MKTFEIKGVKGIILFALMGLLAIAVLIALPVLTTWVTWNALVGDVFHGPLISLEQAALLAAILVICAKLIFQPEVHIQIQKAPSPEVLEKRLKAFQKPDSEHK